MTLPMPTYDGSPETLQFILDLIAEAFIDTGNQAVKLRFGTATITWPGGAPVSNNVNVNHGMGSTPVVAVATPALTGPPWCDVQVNIGATQLTFGAHTTDGTNPANPTNSTVYWIAIG